MTTYHGKPCKKCGGTERYRTSYGCVPCAKAPRLTNSKQEYYQKNKEKWRQSSWERRYGITPDQFQSMWDAQKGLCLVCSDPLRMDRSGHAVDHDHATGRVRSILCSRCNCAVGQVREDERIALAVAEYIRTHCAANERGLADAA